MKDKIRKTDLKYSELPNTRWKVFKDLIKYRKRDMVSLSLLFFVFCLPLAVDIIIFNQFIIIAGNSSQEAVIRANSIFSLIFYMMIVAIPCIVVFFIGLGGLFYVLKKITWQEGVLTGPDFFIGIKKNIKNNIFIGLIYSVSCFLFVVGIFFLLRTMNNELGYLSGMGIGLCVVQFIILSIVCIYAVALNNAYQYKFIHLLKNGFIFFAAKFFKNLLIFILTTGLFVGIMFVDIIAQYVSIFCFSILSSYLMVGWVLLSNEAFDQYINKTNFPELVNKGLYIEKKEENQNGKS